jgi:hypothetical protein
MKQREIIDIADDAELAELSPDNVVVCILPGAVFKHLLTPGKDKLHRHLVELNEPGLNKHVVIWTLANGRRFMMNDPHPSRFRSAAKKSTPPDKEPVN